MQTYYLWTIGCQMNDADAARAEHELAGLGFTPVRDSAQADLIILITCVVRQSAEDRVVGRLTSLKHLKRSRPASAIAVMGCFVHDVPALRERFPYVDAFLEPSDLPGLLEFARSLPAAQSASRRVSGEAAQSASRRTSGEAAQSASRRVSGEAAQSASRRTSGEAAQSASRRTSGEAAQSASRRVSGEAAQSASRRISGEAAQSASRRISGEIATAQGGSGVCALLPISLGCDHHCTYCIVRLRRGRQASRPLETILQEARDLVERGAREITLLGQNVDAYGKDLPGQSPDLADVLSAVQAIEGLWRVRFLTSHPAHMSDKLVGVVSQHARICPHFELPVQSGDDSVLQRMGRGYTVARFCQLLALIRERIPAASVATDIIVGFPGESEAQFQATYDLIASQRFDAVHIAKYSPRPGTPSARLPDDVPPAEKERRRLMLEELQTRIALQANQSLLGQNMAVLVEGSRRGKWYGRNPNNKLIFFVDDSQSWQGRIAQVRIVSAGPWSLSASPLSQSLHGRGPG